MQLLQKAFHQSWVSKVLDHDCFRFLFLFFILSLSLQVVAFSRCPHQIVHVRACQVYKKLTPKPTMTNCYTNNNKIAWRMEEDCGRQLPEMIPPWKHHNIHEATRHDQIKLKLWRNNTKCGTATRQRNARELRGARTIKVCRAIPPWCYSK